MLPDYLKETKGESIFLAPPGRIKRVQKLETKQAGQWAEVGSIPGIMQVLFQKNKHTLIYCCYSVYLESDKKLNKDLRFRAVARE